MAPLLTRWKRGVNAFRTADEQATQDPLPEYSSSYGTSVSVRPDVVRARFTNEKSIITSIYNRIAVDAASVQIRHVRLDDQGRYLNDIDSGLNNCLTVEANLDQAARHFRQDTIMSLLEGGHVVMLPVDTDVRLEDGVSVDILTMRLAEVVQWYPDRVRVSAYNERTGKRQEIVVPKTTVAIVENPFYAVMNEKSSTLQRLIRKLQLLDTVDEVAASGKLDLIVQLPYVIKSEQRKQQAEARRADVEYQLKGSKYGIAYIDGTEKITQLNRPVENNMMAQVEFLLTKLYGELGVTAEIMNGTADEAAMLKYWNGTIEPIVNALVESMIRSFLSKTARTQKQSIMYFRDPFKLIPIDNIAKIADVFSRNEILSANEIRGIIGYKPSDDPKADQLVNSNMPNGQDGTPVPANPDGVPDGSSSDSSSSNDPETIMNSAFDDVDNQLSDLLDLLGVSDDDSVQS